MEELDALLERYAVVFIINDYSPFCFEVQELLKTYPKLDTTKFKVLSSSAAHGNDVERAAARKTRQGAAPYFFVKGLFLGGIKEILSMHESGDLRELFIQAAVLTPPNTTKVEALLAQYPLVVIANSFSPFCLQALGILESYKVAPERMRVLRVDQEAGGKELEDAAAYIANQRELPVVFVGGKPVESVERLLEMHRSCELENMLVENGVLPPADYALLESLVNSKPVVLIGQSFSPFWEGAVEVLERYHVDSCTALIKIDRRKDGKEIHKALRCATNNKNLPYVFIGGEYLGGFTELELLDNADKLEEELVRGKALTEPEVGPLMQLMRQHDLLLLTSSYSPFCLETVHILKNQYRLDQSRLKIVEVDRNPEGDALIKAARYVTRQKQPPYFFVNRKHVKGERNSLAKLHESGELRTILESALDL